MIPRALRAASLVLASAVALTACGGGGDTGEKAVDTVDTSAHRPQPVDDRRTCPTGQKLTEPGTQLAFGDTATVAYENKDQGTALKLRVDSAVQGSLGRLQGFELDDPYKRRGNYYYVRVTVKNSGKDTIGDAPVPLWGISGAEHPAAGGRVHSRRSPSARRSRCRRSSSPATSSRPAWSTSRRTTEAGRGELPSDRAVRADRVARAGQDAAEARAREERQDGKGGKKG